MKQNPKNTYFDPVLMVGIGYACAVGINSINALGYMLAFIYGEIHQPEFAEAAGPEMKEQALKALDNVLLAYDELSLLTLASDKQDTEARYKDHLEKCLSHNQNGCGNAFTSYEIRDIAISLADQAGKPIVEASMKNSAFSDPEKLYLLARKARLEGQTEAQSVAQESKEINDDEFANWLNMPDATDQRN